MFGNGLLMVLLNEIAKLNMAFEPGVVISSNRLSQLYWEIRRLEDHLEMAFPVVGCAMPPKGEIPDNISF